MNDNEPGSKMELQLGRVKEINVGMVCATTKFVCVFGGGCTGTHACMHVDVVTFSAFCSQPQ